MELKRIIAIFYVILIGLLVNNEKSQAQKEKDLFNDAQINIRKTL